MEGIDITAETCPHYLTFCTSDYLEKGCQYGCAPPLKDEKSREGLWEYVKKGVLSCIASDYSPGMPEKPWTINQNELFYKVKLTAFHGLTGKGAVDIELFCCF